MNARMTCTTQQSATSRESSRPHLWTVVIHPGSPPVYSPAVRLPVHNPPQDWTVRTENPWEANLFYVPALTYFYSGGQLAGWLAGWLGSVPVVIDALMR
jgi:hypothetical protein